ncbi:MAG TPA: hypothetical protein VK524_17740 [Polyangiaceae bacterium]|nr:hypothetical protein [Polyangiaceae bacterium]
MGRAQAVVSLLGASVRRSGRPSEPDAGRGLAEALALSGLGDSLLAENAGEVLEHLAQCGEVSAVIVHLPGTAQGADALQRIREQHPLIPILALVGPDCDRARIAQLKCEACELPLNVRELKNFVLRAHAFQRVQAAWRSWLVEYGAKTYGLSSRAAGLLAQAVDKAGPALLMAELGVSHHTLFAQVRRLLTRGSESMDLARADDVLARLLANTSLRDWDRAHPSRLDDATTSGAGKPELRR